MNSHNSYSKTVTLFSQPYLDSYNQCYKNIITVNLMPQGPLSRYVRRINFPPLSTFKGNDCWGYKNCGLALVSPLHNNNCGLMIVDEVPDLISFLVSHGYSVDTSITKMLNSSDIRFDTQNANKIICVVTYNGYL